MNHRQIEAFRAIAHTGTVTAAAKQLHITQPAVSRLLADLQRRLAITLFHKSQGRLKLSAEGLAFLQEVERHYVGLDQLQNAAQRIALHGTNSLSILAIPSLANGLLPELIAALLQQHPHTAISLNTDTTDHIMPRIHRGEFDLGFAMATAPNMSDTARVVATKPWLCVLPPQHELAQQKEIRAEQLLRQDLIGFSPGMSLRLQADILLGRYGAAVSYRLCAQTIESICALVAQGLGVALIHPYTAAVVQRYGLTSRPIQGKHRLSLVAATAPQQQHSLLALKLVELLQQQFS